MQVMIMKLLNIGQGIRAHKYHLRGLVFFFSDHLDSDIGRNVAQEAYNGNMIAEGLDSFEFDDTAVDVMTELCELFSNAGSVNRTVDIAVCGSLGSYSELNICKSSGCSLGFFVNFSDLVGALFLIFGKLLESGVRSDDCETLRNEVVATVTALDLDNIILIT